MYPSLKNLRDLRVLVSTHDWQKRHIQVEMPVFLSKAPDELRLKEQAKIPEHDPLNQFWHGEEIKVTEHDSLPASHSLNTYPAVLQSAVRHTNALYCAFYDAVRELDLLLDRVFISINCKEYLEQSEYVMDEATRKEIEQEIPRALPTFRKDSVLGTAIHITIPAKKSVLSGRCLKISSFAIPGHSLIP